MTEIKIISGERFTPYSLAKKLGAKVLLESASLQMGRSRYSILLIKKAFSVYQEGERIFMEKDRKRFSLKRGNDDFLDIVSYFANQHEPDHYDFPFPAGGIGYIAYEYADRFDSVQFKEKTDSIKIPEAYFIFGHVFLIFDHYTDRIVILGINYREHKINLDTAIREVEASIDDLNFNFMSVEKDNYLAENNSALEEKDKFIKNVEKVKDEIVKGNLLQGVISRRLYLKTKISALSAYKNLRSFNPSPYMFYLDFESFQLFGASPEVHVKVKDRRVIMRPIAGTRKRGRGKSEDAKLEKELLNDEKEKAEHLMLVDLCRNDLGRICKPGSVEVTESMVVERYSHVMHIVSQVEGELADNKTGADAVRATFPAGTVSGAPKIRAMEIIDSLEPEKRGFYAGIVAYFEPGGTMDSCITIRSGLKKGNLLFLQAGAGIVYDSVPEREYEETNSKLAALGKAVGLEV